MIQLNKELQKIAKIENEKLEPLQEVKFLLAGDHQQDLEIMRSLAGNSVVIQAEKTLGIFLEMENINKKYGETFTFMQIRELAFKYQLRFLNSTQFKGKMDIQTISKLKEFATDYKISCLDEWSLKTKFFILAPIEMFVSNDISLSELKEKEKAQRIIDRDPILFYQIDNNHYRMIHKWGNDFTIMRRLKGFIWKSSENYRKAHNFFTILIGCLLSVVSMTIFNTNFANVLGILLFSFVTSLIYKFFAWGFVRNENNKLHQWFFTEFNWRENDRYVD